MPPDISVDVMVPLLVLISLRISDSIRDVDIHQEELVAWGPSGRVTSLIPNLDVVGYLHLINNSLLFFTYLVVLEEYDNSIAKVITDSGIPLTNVALAIVVAVIWMSSPLLGFKEYRYISPTRFGYPISIILYVFNILLIVSILTITDRIERYLPLSVEVGLIIVAFLIMIVGNMIYMAKVQNEISLWKFRAKEYNRFS